MSRIERIAFIGNHLPRQCGIATFTHDLYRAVASARSGVTCDVIAMTEAGRNYGYPPNVKCEIRDDRLADYEQAARFINDGAYDAVSLQHEYGIFGGDAGDSVIRLLSNIDAPIVTTLHTVLSAPSLAQRDVMRRIISLSAKLVVMSQKGVDLLRSVHCVDPGKIELIAHGIPDVPFADPECFKAKLGYSGRDVLLTFGLLSRNKGIETMIDAMPEIVKSRPDAIYIVLGATHPHLVREEGEVFRQSLVERVRTLGMEDHVILIDRFVDHDTLLDFISMCDVYVTPYLNEAQMTSGTLAYSFGLGKPVVSTPYWHAQELLANDRGILVPFGDVGAMGREIAGLLSDAPRRKAMRVRAYAHSRSMTWRRTAGRYLEAFGSVSVDRQPIVFKAAAAVRSSAIRRDLPEIGYGHLLSMCDDTGLLQHAVHNVGDRSHGYCVDDNARALLLAIALAQSDELALPDIMIMRFAAFIQHAWNPATGRFRNFMGYDRKWLEDAGSQDSHGRTLWALGVCASRDSDVARRKWAFSLFVAALPAVPAFTSPRAWAFTLLGLDAFCGRFAANAAANFLRDDLSERLMALLRENAAPDWHWFEEGLAYDNARLPQALLQTGISKNDVDMQRAGIRSLRWLMCQQTSSVGNFRPVGTETFGRSRRSQPTAFDQQPVEAAATISACLSAHQVEPSGDWPNTARTALDWFFGHNDLGISLVDPVSGGCSDGLHPDRRNDNMGAESVLSYLAGILEVRAFQRSAPALSGDPAIASNDAIPGRQAQSSYARGSSLVTVQISKPVESEFAAGSGPSRRPTVQARD